MSLPSVPSKVYLPTRNENRDLEQGLVSQGERLNNIKSSSSQIQPTLYGKLQSMTAPLNHLDLEVDNARKVNINPHGEHPLYVDQNDPGARGYTSPVTTGHDSSPSRCHFLFPLICLVAVAATVGGVVGGMRN